MTDLSTTILPKTDQLNADTLIAGPITIKITKVVATGAAEQPISIYFEGDDGKPYKPGKSMRRVLVQIWGKDGNAYVGKSMTLYRDASVQFGGQAVGGIRISHMSHIDKPVTMALTATRAQRKPYTVQPLVVEAPAQVPMSERIAKVINALDKAKTEEKVRAVWELAADLRSDLANTDQPAAFELQQAFKKRLEAVKGE